MIIETKEVFGSFATCLGLEAPAEAESPLVSYKLSVNGLVTKVEGISAGFTSTPEAWATKDELAIENTAKRRKSGLNAEDTEAGFPAGCVNMPVVTLVLPGLSRVARGVAGLICPSSSIANICACAPIGFTKKKLRAEYHTHVTSVQTNNGFHIYLPV